MTTESTPPPIYLEPPARDGDLGRLGPYHVVRMLGRGGMGQVFAAQDSRLRRTVAIKVMNDRVAASANSRGRFLEEARAMAAVQHDHVATIYEVGERGGVPYMAMEMLRGDTLAARSGASRPWPTDRIVRLATEVARGLAAAHGVGIIHRDIKPANLWIEEPTRRVKILDFGLAVASSGMAQLAGGSTVIGTPGYLAPEQARNEPLDERTDLYSLGVVMYELAAGKLPLNASTVVGQLIAILTHDPPPIREINPAVPEPLAELIHRLIAKEPRHRPSSAKRLGSMLGKVAEACDEERRVAVQIVTESPAAAKSPAVPKPELATDSAVATDRPGGRRRRRVVPWVVSAAALLVTAPLLGWGLSRPGKIARETQSPEASTQRERRDRVAPVLAANLRPLELTEVVAGSTRVVRGEAARFRMGLTNHAGNRDDDPRRIHADAKVAAQVVCYLRRPGQLPRKAPAYPKRLAPAQLPAPGESAEVEIQFITAKLPQETFEVIFELQSPAGGKVGSVSSELTVTENLREDDLLGFETLRTHVGRGADATVRRGAEEPLGTKPVIQIRRRSGGTTEHAYLRFDLEKSPVPREEIDRAVLLLTVDGGGSAGRSTIQAYGVPPSTFGGQGTSAGGSDGDGAENVVEEAWTESGPDALRFEISPSRDGVGGLPFLGQATIDNRDGNLKHETDRVRIVGPNLDDFLRSDSGPLATIVLVRENAHDKPTRFRTKEGKPDQAPALAIRRRLAD